MAIVTPITEATFSIQLTKDEVISVARLAIYLKRDASVILRMLVENAVVVCEKLIKV